MCIYEPLQSNEIRLFYLEPGSKSPHDSLRLSIFINHLECLPPYEALSYVWGDNSNPISITVNEQQFYIGRNLYDALIELRAEMSPRRIFWVDAICINQLNESEKSHQVARMVEIYDKAFSTTMWIGKEDKALGSALHDVQGLNKSTRVNNLGQDDELSYTFGNKLPHSMDLIMSQAYFSRSWITQEVAVSKCLTVTAGSVQFDFDELSLAFRTISKFQPGSSKYGAQFVALDALRKAVSNIRKVTYDKTGDSKDCPEDDGFNHDDSNELIVMPDLTHLLISERDKGATDPRDKVYALLGVSGMSGCSQFSPDYSTTINELYAAVAVQLVQQSRGLRILSSSQPRYSTRNLPSWVPDWSQPWRGGIDRRDEFSAGKSLEPHVRVSTDNKTLLLHGLKLDTIRRTHMIPFKDWKYTDILDPPAVILEAEAARLGLRGQYCTTETYPIVLLQILVAGRGPRVMNTDLTRFVSYASTGDFEWNPLNPHKRRWDLLKHNLAWSNGEWDMFETELGLLGLGPTHALPGDVVYIFGGGNVPFILRPWEEKGYKLIGECYLHGFMEGQLDSKPNIPVEEIMIW
jgi:hypothetical protein